MDVDTWVIVPCYNEADRLDPESIRALAEGDRLQVLLINDGSVDDTWDVIREIARDVGEGVEIMGLMSNVGKAEAVRRGLNRAVANGARIVGYMDADFSTPAAEMHRLLDILKEDEHVAVLLGSRWQRLGANIVRSNLRHYSGRAFATLASNILKMQVYDTQCGAKLFRVTENLKAALSQPFLSRWAFDVELIGRLREGVGTDGYALDEFIEVPLDTWIDIKGSKVRLLDTFKVAIEMILIHRYLKRLRG